MPAPEPIPDLLKSANDASARGFALWVTFLTVEIYLAIAAGTTTHRALLLQDPVKLPLLSVDLPLFAFYVFAPLLFVCLHLYVLAQLYLLARTLRMLDGEMQAARLVESDRGRLRAQLDSFVLTQLLVGARTTPLVRWFLRLSVWLTLLAFPVLLLLLMQLRFLPYHSQWTTWVQRTALLLDLGLIWAMWPAIVVGARVSGRTRPWSWGRGAMAVVCVALAVFSVVVATVPEEQIEKAELRLGPVHDQRGNRLWWPTWVLSGGVVDWLPRNLVLSNEHLVDLDQDALAKKSQTLLLRGRDLRRAVLINADLRKVVLSGAHLQGAVLNNAQLQGAVLTFAHLQGAALGNADLQGAVLRGADLQGAVLLEAHLQGAVLSGADLQGADLRGAGVWRADLRESDTGLVDGRELNAAAMLLDEAQSIITSAAKSIPNRNPRDDALKRLSILADTLPTDREQALVEAVMALSRRGWDETKDDPELARFLGTLGCQPENAPYIAHGLLLRMQYWREEKRPYQPLLARTLRDPACAGARGLTANEAAKLDRIAAQTSATPPRQ